MRFALLLPFLATLALAAPETQQKMSADEKIVFDIATAQVTAFNEGNAAAYVAFFTNDAEWRDESGGTLSGKAAIEKAMTEAMTAEKGRKLDIDVDSVRRISPDVLSAKGSTSVTFADGTESTKGFIAVYVRRDGKWSISDYTESLVVQTASVEDLLKPLEWLVGTWEQKSEKLTVRTTAEWSLNKRFLNRTTSIQPAGEPAQTTVEHIGWDAALGVVRSWVFDSDGGVTENIWQQSTSGWSIACVSTLPDGLTATAELEITKVDENTQALSGKKRTIAGEPLPDMQEQRLVRVSKK